MNERINMVDLYMKLACMNLLSWTCMSEHYEHNNMRTLRKLEYDRGVSISLRPHFRATKSPHMKSLLTLV